MITMTLALFGGIAAAVLAIAWMDQYRPSVHLAFAGCFRLIEWREKQREAQR